MLWQQSLIFNILRENEMKCQSMFAYALHTMMGLLSLLALLACASQSQTMYYGFEFDMKSDGQNAVVLDYRLSADAKLLVAADPNFVADYGGLTTTSEHKQSVLPTDFYVRWRNTISHVEYDRKIDLRGKLPSSIDESTFYFMIVNDHVQIYIATHAPRAPDQPPLGPAAFRARAVVLIYSE